MPRPCAVEAHVRGYKIGQISFADATALCRGGSRPWLRKIGQISLADATALRRGGSRWWLQNSVREVLRMPRPCAVEVHAGGYKIAQRSFADATALRPGIQRVSSAGSIYLRSGASPAPGPGYAQ